MKETNILEIFTLFCFIKRFSSRLLFQSLNKTTKITKFTTTTINKMTLMITGIAPGDIQPARVSKAYPIWRKVIGWKTICRSVVLPITYKFRITQSASGRKPIVPQIKEVKIFLIKDFLIKRSITTTPVMRNAKPANLTREAIAITLEEAIRSNSFGFSIYFVNRNNPRRPKKINKGSVQAIEWMRSMSNEVNIKNEPNKLQI